MFLKLTSQPSIPRYINMDLVEMFEPLKGEPGSRLQFNDGASIDVTESPEDIAGLMLPHPDIR